MVNGGSDRSMSAKGNGKTDRSGVKTLSIIETLSELATDKTEASRLTLPSPVRILSNTNNSQPNHLNLPPRNPKVSVPFHSPSQQKQQQMHYINPPNHVNSGYNGAKPRFLTSSVANSVAKKMHSSIIVSPIASTKMNLSAITNNNKQSTPVINNSHHSTANQNAGSDNSQRGQTPDWIRDIFHHAKRGNREKLVSLDCIH